MSVSPPLAKSGLLYIQTGSGHNIRLHFLLHVKLYYIFIEHNSIDKGFLGTVYLFLCAVHSVTEGHNGR